MSHDENPSGLAEARFAALLDAAVDAILVIDNAGSIETFNRAAEGLFGYRAAEVLGKNVSMLMPEPYRGEHDRYIGRYLQTGEKRIIGIGREVRGLRSNGDIFPLELSVGEVKYAGQARFVGIIRDITERIETQQKLRQHQERMEHVTRLSTLGEMAAGIAHEINQPLTAIATYAQATRRLVASGEIDQARLMNVLDKTSAQAERAGQIIRRIRNLARKQPAQRELRDINAVVEDALRLAEPDARLHELRLVFEPGTGLPDVWVDPVQLQQVVLNLLRNAIEAAPESEQIRIQTRHQDKNKVIVQVIDRGPGIDPESLAEIFDPFYTTKTLGSGLGLSISRSIVAAHGGQLDAVNNEDGGATFRVILPVTRSGTRAGA